MRIRTLLLGLNVGLAAVAVQVAIAQNDWPSYGRDPGAQRYSPLTQINAGNVSTLVQAWKYETRPASSVAKSNKESKTTPLMVNDVVYFVTPFQSLVAVEPETGKTLWTFDHQHAARTSRGIAYWPGNKNAPPTVFFGTEDGFLIGVNARTGKLVPGFAKEGELDLKPGMKGPGLESAPYGLNGAPAIYKNLVFTGTHLQDNGSYGGRGDVRAWDAGTGKLVWTFHTVPQPGEVGHETWLDTPESKDGWKNRSGVNVWSTFTVDAETGTLLMPIGGPSDDRYGGDRPGANLFGNSLVAVDAMTGKMKWYLQTVHHDLWDYDLPPQPTLIDVVKDGKKIPALIQTTKTGLVFILDRRTGKAIYDIEERPVPKGDVPGEWYSPTQPFPVKPPQLARSSWKPDEITKFTPEQQKYCEDLFKNAKNEGPYTPVRMTDSVVFPGSDGGFNWGGGSYDPKLGYFFINSHDQGAIQKMVAQVPAKERPTKADSSQMPFVRRNVGPITNPATGWPCQSPPWGELFAINVNTGDVAWRVPFGRVESLEKIGVMNTGSYNIGGSIATASGLLFIGATSDQRFHAYESKTGKLLWETKLPANAYANPITYLGKDGKQYILVAAQETMVAFRLP